MKKEESKMENKVDDFDEKALEVEVKSARLLIQTLLQALKGYRLYEPNHPMLGKFLDRLERDFDHYFEDFDTFALQVGEHALFYRGKSVYENKDVKESLAFHFYRDGIRELRFFKGLDHGEIVDFLNVVRKADFINRLDDDLVTLLWEKDFSQIAFTFIDEFLEDGRTLVPATEEDLRKRLEYKGPLEEGVPEKTEETEESHGLEAEGLKQAINPSPGQSLVQACQLTHEEMESINREAQQEQDPEYIYTLVHSLIEILLHLGEDMDAYENMISFFERTPKSLLEQGKIEKAVKILTELNETLESIVLKDKQIFAIRRILEAPSRPEFIQLLGKSIKSGAPDPSDSVKEYFKFLTNQAIEPLCQLLGELETGKSRKMICDCLMELCKDEIQPLIKYLSDPNPFLVSHILYILGKVAHPSTLKHLGSLVNHPDPKMREETLKLLTQFGEKGKDMIEKFLKDPLPEIRGKASLTLAKVARNRAVRLLVDIVLSEDFYKRDFDEKAYFFRALGETGSKEVIPILQDITKKRRWFNRAKWDEMRQCANNALRMIGTERASP